MWEKIAFHKNKIFVILVILFMPYWLSVPEEEIENPYIMSVDYDCREIIRDPTDIPNDIIHDCKDLVEQLEKENAPKQSK